MRREENAKVNRATRRELRPSTDLGFIFGVDLPEG